MKALTQILSDQTKETVKATILWKLRTGRAYTAIELAGEAKVSKKEVYSYLNEFIELDLLVEIERRKRGYYRLLNDDVEHALHDHYLKTGVTESKLKDNDHPTGMKYCRTCYSHLAGKIGVQLSEQLMQKGFIKIGNNTHFKLTPKGDSFFKDFGIDTDVLRKKRSRFAKACIDFSERKYHLGGALGKALFDKMEEKDWVQRIENAREIKITPQGKKAFAEMFQIDV